MRRVAGPEWDCCLVSGACCTGAYAAPAHPVASLFACRPQGCGFVTAQLLSLFLLRQVQFISHLFPSSPVSADSSCFPPPSAFPFHSCPPVGGAEGVCPLFPPVSVRCPCSPPAPESWVSLARDCCFVQLHESGSAALFKSGESPIACGKLDLS